MNHPGRLQASISVLVDHGLDAIYQSEHMHLFEDINSAHVWSWLGKPNQYCHPGTMLARKPEIPRYNNALSRREDLEVLQRLFVSGKRIGLVSGMAHLHMYVYHGTSTVGREHHKRLESICAVDREALGRMEPCIKRALPRYHLAAPIPFLDHEGRRVFVWNGSARDRAPETASAGRLRILWARDRKGVPSDKGPPQGIDDYCAAQGIELEDHRFELWC